MNHVERAMSPLAPFEASRTLDEWEASPPATDRLVLVAEPDRAARSAMVRALSEAGYQVAEAGDGPYALRQAFSETPGVVVLNLNIPLLSGVELVKVLRAASDMGIVVVSDSHSSQLAVRVLEAGADDYVSTRIELSELVARIRATLRRVDRRPVAGYAAPSDLRVVRTGTLTINPEAHTVLKRGEEVPMTRIEYQLISALGRRLGQVAPHRYLLTEVWGAEYLDDTHYLRGYIASLRSKLEDDPAHPRLLLTEWGVGYRLAALPVEGATGLAAAG